MDHSSNTADVEARGPEFHRTNQRTLSTVLHASRDLLECIPVHRAPFCAAGVDRHADMEHPPEYLDSHRGGSMAGAVPHMGRALLADLVLAWAHLRVLHRCSYSSKGLAHPRRC